MSSFQPSVPSGMVFLDQDYANIQQNFAALDTYFGANHVPFSVSALGTPSGYHTEINMVPFSTVTSNGPNNQPVAAPSATPGFGQIFSAQINDGIGSADEALYYLSGGGKLTQLTRNFAPATTANGYTFLPGGLILQYGSSTAVKSSGSTTITFPIPFPVAVYSVQCTVVTSDNSTIRFSILNNSALDKFITTQTSTSKFTNLYWTAIGK